MRLKSGITKPLELRTAPPATLGTMVQGTMPPLEVDQLQNMVQCTMQDSEVQCPPWVHLQIQVTAAVVQYKTQRVGYPYRARGILSIHIVPPRCTLSRPSSITSLYNPSYELGIDSNLVSLADVVKAPIHPTCFRTPASQCIGSHHGDLQIMK